MNLSRTNLVLAVLLTVVIVSTLSIDIDHSRPNYQIYMGDDMTYSPSYSPYDPNPIFDDGRTAQAPVVGTIARGELSMHFESTLEDALRAGEQLKNPYEPRINERRNSVESGALAYDVFCTACHGSGGAGDGPVSKRGYPPPPSLLTGKTLQMKDGQLFHILTYGQGSMPAFAAQLSPGRRWDIVNYLRSIQRQTDPSDAAAVEAAVNETGASSDTETPKSESEDESQP